MLHATLLHCKLKSVVARITTHLKHCHATKFRYCKLKQPVTASWTGVYFFQEIFSTCNNKFRCVKLFEVGGNTCNNKLQRFVARITSPLSLKTSKFETQDQIYSHFSFEMGPWSNVSGLSLNLIIVPWEKHCYFHYPKHWKGKRNKIILKIMKKAKRGSQKAREKRDKQNRLEAELEKTYES